MRYLEHKVCHPNNFIIKSFYLLESERVEQSQFFLPDGNPELMVSNFPISVLSTSKSILATGSCLFWGQFRFPGYITCSQPYKIFGIKFQPWVLQLITNSRYPILVDRIVSGNLVFNSAIIKYVHNLIDNNDFKKSLDYIEEELSDLIVPRILNQCLEHRNFINVVIKLKQNPKIKISDLILEYDKSFRTLQYQFQQNIGITPKEYQLIVRLRKASERIRAGEKIIHAALDSGYYDQAHFNKEFKYATLKNPSQFLWNENLILSTI